MTSSLLMTAADEAPVVDLDKRTISGLAVPYGPAGQTSAGRLTFARGSIRWTDPKRVKLLIEHDQRESVGYATELTDTDDGLRATFLVAEGDDGDRALLQAANGTRDGFSVGVQLDDVVVANLGKARGKPTPGKGALRETSLVAVPAFDDARVAAQHSALVVSSWHANTTTTEGHDMTDTATVDATAASADSTTTDAAPITTAAIADMIRQELTALGRPAGGIDSPAPVTAVAGAATITSEPAVYAFDGTGPSMTRDVFQARQGDRDAAERLAKFQGAMSKGDPTQIMALAAVAVTGDNSELIKNGHRPDLAVQAVDRGRPLFSRAGVKVTLTDATPFTIPVIGEFDGIATHTEGTAHAAEGTQTIGEVTVTPKAKSGAFRVSREMVDASNPAIDRIVVAAMLRDYRRETEAELYAALEAADATPVINIDTVLELRTQLAAFGDANSDVPADFVASSTSYYQTLLADVAGDGRPQLPFVGPTNVVGTNRAGYTGASIDGTELFKSSSVDAAVAYALRADAIMAAEGRVQTFRFEEVEGPGVIKFALWAYVAAQVLDANGVVRYTSAAA